MGSSIWSDQKESKCSEEMIMGLLTTNEKNKHIPRIGTRNGDSRIAEGTR